MTLKTFFVGALQIAVGTALASAVVIPVAVFALSKGAAVVKRIATTAPPSTSR